MNFTPMAKNVCRILLCEQELKENKADISNLPLGDLFRTTSLTPEDYQLFSKHKSYSKCNIDTKNTFYSSEYMKLIGNFLKKTA